MSIEERLRGLEQYKETLHNAMDVYPNAVKFKLPVTLPNHDAITLDTDADTLLGLTGQQITLDDQAANKVLAGPTSGADATPTYRSLVKDDLPSPYSGTQSANRVLAGPSSGADAQPTYRALVVADLPVPHWVYPSMPEWVTNGGTAYTPLTSTSWDGDSYSTTANTVIDLSTVFNVPAGVKAVKVRVAARDSGSAGAAASACRFIVKPASTGEAPLILWLSGKPNDYTDEKSGDVPCDANGDIYYELNATGAGTMDVWLQVWGYFL